MASIRLYKLVGGVPKGSQDKKTNSAANHSSGAKPERKDRKNLTHNGNSGGTSTVFFPFSMSFFAAIGDCSP
jgi:hypothetical protein